MTAIKQAWKSFFDLSSFCHWQALMIPARKQLFISFDNVGQRCTVGSESNFKPTHQGIHIQYTHTYARKHWDAYVIVMLINTETQALGQDWDPPNPPILAYDLLSLAHLQNIEFHKYFCMSKTMS